MEAARRVRRPVSSRLSVTVVPFLSIISISRSTAAGNGSRSAPNEPHTCKFARKHLSAVQHSSTPLPLRASSKVRPLEFHWVPITSRAIRMASTLVAIADRTSKTCSSNHSLVKAARFPPRAAPSREDVAREPTKRSRSSPASCRASASATCGLPMTTCRAGRFASGGASLNGWKSRSPSARRSQTATKVSKNTHASATPWSFSGSRMRRSLAGAASTACSATSVRNAARSGMVQSFGSQIITL
mmetsp:Transcript_85169/g.246239  ORF Transcript_85169/g.246239 Transcript_85169/m.246239 type:complete len:244 (+) Transcript_85169:37-768(+)